MNMFRMEDFDAEEEDEEALIEQRRQQRLAIVQVTQYSKFFWKTVIYFLLREHDQIIHPWDSVLYWYRNIKR